MPILAIKLQCFGLGQKLALVGQVLGGKLVHFLFNFCKIVRCERLGAKELVEEAGVNRRSNTQFDVGIKLHYRGRQQMCGGVPEYVQ